LFSKFWDLVDRSRLGPGGCWEWQGRRRQDGYGRVYDPRRKRQQGAHRISFELAYGPIPGGLLVMHRCDHPPCVNPDHLEIGTIGRNTRDASARGRLAFGGRNGLVMLPHRAPHGERNRNAKLTSAQVSEMRRLRAENGMTYEKLAAIYCVGISTVGKIIKGRRWRIEHMESWTSAVEASKP
jgi:hypothetical protein